MRRFCSGVVCAATMLAAAPVAAAEGGGSALISPNPGTLIWTVVTFALFAFILGRFAWKPMLAALNERERTIRDSIDGAKRDREEAERILGEQRALLEQARRERAEAVAAGQRDAEKLKEEILDQARAERERMIEQSRAQVEAGMRQARAELRREAVDLALRAAEKLITRNLDDATQRKLVEEHLADLERGGGAAPPPA